jgi:hypothetical protein
MMKGEFFKEGLYERIQNGHVRNCSGRLDAGFEWMP